MRILFRHLDPGQGGAVSSGAKMLQGFCERFPQDELTVMCAADSPFANLSRFGNCDVELVGTRAPREAHLLGLGDIAVRRLCRKRAYDVFLTVNVGLYVRSSLPQVLMVNNAYQIYPAEIAALNPCSRLRVACLRGLFRRSLALSQAAVVQTPLMERYLRKLATCPQRVAIVPKAVASERDGSEKPLPRRIANEFAKSPDSARLLFVSTGFPHKNHRVLSEMMELFREKGSPIRLVVTLSDQKWRERTGEVGGRLVESGHVIPVGWVEKDELKSLYGACDVCVMPSLIESLSSAHIEAMHWRKPQVVADVDYAHDLCLTSALYADPHDPAAWVSQVERVLTDDGLRQSLIKQGIERFSTFPSTWAQMAGEIRSVLANVVGEPASQSASRSL